MATLDDGIANLQRFIAHLTASTGALEKSAEHFKETGQRFTELEDEAETEGGGLNDELEELGSALDSGLHAAEDALTDLTQTTKEGEDTSGEAQQRLEEAAAALDEQAERTLSELGDANARLVTLGFEALGATLNQSQKELEAESQESAQVFDQLESAVGELQTEAEAAWDAAEAELDESIAELGQSEQALEAAADQAVKGFDAAAAEFEQRCSDLASEIDVIYDALDAAVAQEGQEWQQHVAGLAKEAVAFIENGAQESLEQPANLVENEALTALEQEYSALGGVFEVGTDTAGALAPLAEELARCQSVVATVDELMKAIAS